eukprot:CRZ08590.1 hypothetical protein [Spongospora subterranea]
MLLYVNGKRIELDDDSVDTTITVLEFLRHQLRLTGSKLACHEASCGACTVLVSHYDHNTSTIVHNSVNACIAPLCSIADKSVTTIEGVSRNGRLIPLQQRIVDSNGSQCGFCTPGIVMSVYSLMQNQNVLNEDALEEALDGSLCRCTGYRPIVDAIRPLCSQSNCHSKANLEDIEDITKKCEYRAGEVGVDTFDKVMFPDELRHSTPRTIVVGDGDDEKLWFRPVTLKELLHLKDKYRTKCKIAVGFTELGIERYAKNAQFTRCIATTHVPELTQTKICEKGLLVGSAVTISQLKAALQRAVETLDPQLTLYFVEFLEQIRWFAGRSVRNVGTVGGNLMTASPISDLNPLHVCFGSVLQFESHGGGIRNLSATKLFKSYRVVDCREDEVLISVLIQFSIPGTYCRAYKVSRRRDDDIAIVCSGMQIQKDVRTNCITEAMFSFGGMAPTTVSAPRTAMFLRGKTFSVGLFDAMMEYVQLDLPLSDDAPGGMGHFRRTVVLSLLFKFMHYVAGSGGNASSLSHRFTRPPSKGLQYFCLDPPLQSHSVGIATPHLAGELHVTGKALYSNDVAVLPGALFVALVLSEHPHALIRFVDWSAALNAPGVHSYLDHKSVPGSNILGPVVPDEELFAVTEVHCMGAAIGAILADTEANAQAAARLVSVKYEILPYILNIKEAIAAESYFAPPHKLVLCRGDVDKALGEAEVVVKGSVHIGAQEHFYMEPQTAIAVCGEGDEVEVLSSTQNPTKTQTFVAKALGIQRNRVVCRVKRIGGGFGGKETRSIFVCSIAAIGAKLTGRQVRCTLPRDVDMSITGTRHPFFGVYHVGVSRLGILQAVDIQLYSDGGCSQDLSVPVMERALFHAENSYFVPALRCTGRICKTNTPSNTAFRGFGGPQGMFVAETWLEHVARELSIDRHEIIRMNLFGKSDHCETYFGQQMPSCPLQQMWSDLFRTAEVDRRKAEIEQFNCNNQYVKRGIACVPTKFGMSFTLKFMNQAAALVHCYTDGTVLVTHGGTEMGQGLHTKMCAVAAHELQIPIEHVYISETATDKV